MKVLVYGINFPPELTATGKYTGEMVYWMVEQGYSVHVVTAPPYYPEWSIHKGYSGFKFKKEKGIVDIYRCPLYVPHSLSTFKRLIHLFSFATSSFFPLMKHMFWKPDYIICIAPTLLCAPGAILLGYLTKATIILHIQDFEIDAMLGLNMVRKGILSGFSMRFEKWCLSHVSFVSTISQSMISKVIAKGVNPSKAIYFPNWSEIERFQSISPELVEELKINLELPSEKKIILYAGNLGEKQGLESVIDVAEISIHKNYLFLFVGEGGGKKKLEKMVFDKKLFNVIFRPLQPYDKLPALLKLADCHLVIQRKGAADSVLPSKLTNILALGGNAVITAEKNTELGQLCEKYPGIAICIEPESSSALQLGIEKCLQMPLFNQQASKYAQDSLDKAAILKRFMDDLKMKNG